jgi:hypothetical protein
MATPETTFFSSSDSALPHGLRVLFTTLSTDFSVAATRPFLQLIGVQESPSIPQITEWIIKDPEHILALCTSSERYLSLIRLIAANFHSIGSKLRSEMKLTKWFLGSTRSENDEDEVIYTYQLCRVADVIIVDDSSAAMIFAASILGCPQESSIESVAETLGSKRLSKLVSEDYRVVGENGESSKSRELKKSKSYRNVHHLYHANANASLLFAAIIERSYLFLSQIEKKELRHSPEWLKNHLVVFEVRVIDLIRTLQLPGTAAVKRHSSVATAHAKTSSNGIIVYVTLDSSIDWYEIAAALCSLLLIRRNTNDALVFMNILSTRSVH